MQYYSVLVSPYHVQVLFHNSFHLFDYAKRDTQAVCSTARMWSRRIRHGKWLPNVPRSLRKVQFFGASFGSLLMLDEVETNVSLLMSSLR